MTIVYRHPEAQHVRTFLNTGKDQPVPDLPVIRLFTLTLQKPPFDNPIFRQIKGDLNVAYALPLPFYPPCVLRRVVAEHSVKPFDVNRVENVFDGLEPVAWRHCVADLTPDVLL